MSSLFDDNGSFAPWDQSYLENPEQIKRLIQQLEKLKFAYAANGWFSGDEVEAIIDETIYLLEKYSTLLTEKTQTAETVSSGDKRPPAYRLDIDANKIYELHQQGKSMREIARQMGCAADTVKRRIEEIEQRLRVGD